MTNHYESYGFRRILEEFIDTYRNQPCLWQMKHEDYHNREKKTNAYNKLIVLYKKIEPKADRDTIVKKINALRTTYRKEKKKVEESKLSGTEYVPTLWYFNLLKFLDDDQTMIKSSRSSVDEIDCYQEIEQIEIHADDYSTGTASTPEFPEQASSHPTPSKRKRHSLRDEHPRDWPIEILLDDSYYENFGKIVAAKLRCLAKDQRLLAEKMINDILFHAEMGDLTYTEDQKQLMRSEWKMHLQNLL